MIEFKFNVKKATQVTCLLLKLNNGKMNYTKLIKILYLIERLALKRFNEPIIGDQYFSLPKGPILSNVLNLIKGKYFESSEYWDQYISRPSNNQIMLNQNCRDEELSPREIELIEETYSVFSNFSYSQMITFCHKYIPEWKKPIPPKKREPIQVTQILKKLKLEPKQIEYIKEEADWAHFLSENFN